MTRLILTALVVVAGCGNLKDTTDMRSAQLPTVCSTKCQECLLWAYNAHGIPYCVEYENLENIGDSAWYEICDDMLAAYEEANYLSECLVYTAQ